MISGILLELGLWDDLGSCRDIVRGDSGSCPAVWIPGITGVVAGQVPVQQDWC